MKFAPTDDMMERLEADGELLAVEVKRSVAAKKSIARKSMSMGGIASLALDERVRAIGHITTSLSLITAHINGNDSLVPVTWVSQASFNPPGITISVPKEGSPDGLTLLNAKFTINIMGEGKQVATHLPPDPSSGEDVCARYCGQCLMELLVPCPTQAPY